MYSLNEFSGSYMIKRLLPKKILILFLYIFMAFSNTACGKEKMELTVNLSAYNHTENGVGGYVVTLSNGSRVEAGFLAPGKGGGGMTCCLSIPKIWRPGLTANIIMSSIENGKEIHVEKNVPVPKYTASDVGMFIVHFLHDGTYKVFVTKYVLGHRKYPLSGKEAELRQGVPIEIIWE